jgi:RluA family pseudouridine synthase
MNVSSKVPASFKGMSILEYLGTRFTYLSEKGWFVLVQEGRVFCNDVKCNVRMIVSQDDIIRCNMPDFKPPDVNFDYSIVYEDEWLLGVNKPAGLRVHSSGKFVNANLIYHLRHVRQPAYPDANLVNRLDTDTSGLVMLARDKTVLRHLERQFTEGTVDKCYLAVVTGRPTPAKGIISLPIGPIRETKVPRFGIDHKQGKAAITHYTTIRELGNNFTLLELKPKSGRTHQLRVHMAAMGHPIAGDALYTMNDDEYLNWRRTPRKQAILQRQALHSYNLRFLHPIFRTTYTLKAAIANDMENFIKGLTEEDG